MLKMLKQARAALSMLRPEEVRKRAARSVTVGLVASHESHYEAMEEFLLPADMPPEQRDATRRLVHRAGERDAPERVDVVFYEAGVHNPEGTFTLRVGEPAVTDPPIQHDHELALPLARQFPVFRKSVVDHIIQSVSRENALFAITTALPDIIPSLIELPWSLGEFASDSVFLTANQIRMAFFIAAACGKEPGFGQQKAEVLSIVASAFGWRALARELVGKIPLGGGIIPKGAIAYAGTFAVGKGLEYFHQAGAHYTREQINDVYQRAFERGKDVVHAIAPQH